MLGAVEVLAVKECVSFVVSTPFLVKEYVDKLDDEDGSDTSGVCANVVVRGSTTAGLYCIPACCWTPVDCCAVLFSFWPLPANCCEEEPGGASPKYSTCSLLILVQPLMKRCMVQFVRPRPGASVHEIFYDRLRLQLITKGAEV